MGKNFCDGPPEEGVGRVFVPGLDDTGEPGAPRYSQARHLADVNPRKNYLLHLPFGDVKAQYLGRQVRAVFLKDVNCLGCSNSFSDDCRRVLQIERGRIN